MQADQQGANFARYAVNPRVLIFITRPGEILLLKGAPTKRLWANRYNALGGHIERGEDVYTAAQRELREETGITVPLHLCGLMMVDTGGNPGVALYIFRNLEEDAPHGALLPSEEGTLHWVSPAQLESLPILPDLPQLLPRVLAWQPGSAPFSARLTFADDDTPQIVFFG
ncbi:MAG: hypothetical protein OHK0052_23030 [Anaerolineales bacterium]